MNIEADDLIKNQCKTEFLDHDYRGRWYCIPVSRFDEWSRLVQKREKMDADPLYETYRMFRVKPSKQMRAIFNGGVS